MSRMREDYVHKRRAKGGAGDREMAVGRRPLGLHRVGTRRHRRGRHHVRGLRRVHPRRRHRDQADRAGPRRRHRDRRVLRAHDARPRRHGAARREGVVDAALARPRAPPLRHRGRSRRARTVARRLAGAATRRPSWSPRTSTCRTTTCVLVTDVSFRAEPGESLVVTSTAPASARALLLTVAGRLAPTDGRLRVAGHLLPERGAWVRAHVGVALLRGSRRAARRAEAGPPRTHDRSSSSTAPTPSRPAQLTQAAGMLRDAAHRHGPRLGDRPRLARALLTEAGRFDAPTSSTSHEHPPLSSLEVNA